MKLFIASLITVVAFLSQDAHAISLRFKFKVFSSGPHIYACNAGLVSRTNNQRVCYFQGTTNTCTPDDCSTTGQNCNSSCVCSSTNGGDYLMNFGKLKFRDWKDHGDNSVTNPGTKTFQANSVDSWKQAFTDVEAWDKRISDLSFELGSELYSAQYFVDICYRGPQIEYFENNINTNFSLFAQAYATDFLAQGVNGGENNRDGLIIPSTGIKYTELAGVKVQAFVTCDLQGVGNLKYARNNSDVYNTSVNEAGFVGGILPTGATEGMGSFHSSSQMGISTSQADLIDDSITSGSPRAPRFCKIRYIFTETNYASSLPNLRRWQRHGAEMCTFTEIIENAQAQQNMSPMM